MRDDFSKSPYLCGFQADEGRDERFFLKFSVIKLRIGYGVRVMSMMYSDYVFKLFGLVLRGCSLGWNDLFPTWEQFIPNVGILCSQRGNKNHA